MGPYKKDSLGNEIKEYIPLNAENLLLRGCMLRNTEFVYGIVIFTGHSTKIMQNSSSGKYKFSASGTYALLFDQTGEIEPM